MKGGLAVAVAAMAGGAAANINHRHAHDLFKRGGAAHDQCTTIWSTITGAPTLCVVASTPSTTSTTPTSTSVKTTATSTSILTSTSTPPPPPPPPPAPTTTSVVVPVVPLPTPEPHVCPTPGTYTFSATTITVDKTTTVCGAASTHVPSGTHTVGGVTTVVETATTVTCPYATVVTSGSVTTSTIAQTEYVCPSAGTYTIAPITTTVTCDTTVVYPTPTSICPGTYTHPEQVVTVTETDFVYYCPYTSSGLPTTTAKPETVPAAPTSVPAAPTVVPKPKPKPSTPKPSHSGGGASGLSGDNDHWGVTYNPYNRDNGNCLTAAEVKNDIKDLKDAGFQVVRTYSTDCGTLDSVGEACKEQGMGMIIGVFITSSGCTYESPDIKEQVDAIAKWADWDIVKLFVIGNEAILPGICTASELADLITTVKSKCSGYTGPYTTSDTVNVWQQPEVASALCPLIDVLGANIHAYFNPETVAKDAGKFVSGQVDILKKICSGLDVTVLECGWPKEGNCQGVACPSVDNQAAAISSIREIIGDKTVFFSGWDELWKDAGECMCEKSWGANDCFSNM